ncbi:hypothetical protein EVAR_65405_1 [Eumeta japonica]|uniref:Uncharacterized protein n=1 Tax=Eumeta variegata TaxID=151549 RepID=A0A4C1ZSL4_EUMVA|nr:hypothetical protein EVAR_65405_1 [Eumeta japonica]
MKSSLCMVKEKLAVSEQYFIHTGGLHYEYGGNRGGASGDRARGGLLHLIPSRFPQAFRRFAVSAIGKLWDLRSPVPQPRASRRTRV